MSRKSLQPPGHIHQLLHLLIGIIERPKFRIGIQRPVQGDIQLLRHHFGDGIHKGIRQIHDTPHIPQHAPGRQRTEGHDLRYPLLPVLSHHIIDDFLTPFHAEINIDIRHGHTLRIQETLKQKLIPYRIDAGDPQRIGHQASCRRTSPGPHCDPVILCIFDKIPYDQEIIHISHLPDDGQFIIQPLLQRTVVPGIAFPQALRAFLIQILPCRISLRHIISWQLRHSELNLHPAPISNLLRILKGAGRIGKQLCHLFRRFNIILSSLIAHPVLIRQTLPGLQTEQDIMRLHIILIRIMNIIGRHKLYLKLPAHAHQRLIHLLLRRNPVILKLQEEISLTEDLFILLCCPACLLILPFNNILLYLACQTRAQGNDSFMICAQDLFIHPGAVVKAFRKPDGDDLHQILVSLIVLCQQNQMIITVLASSGLLVEPGLRSYIHLAPKDRPDPLGFGFFIKIDHSVHDPMVRDGSAVHPKLLYPRHIFPDLV